MPTINVTTRDGHAKSFEGTNGQSLMENLRSHGVDEVLALCGGCLSCATCHVYVDEDWLSALPPMSEDEDDLLDSSGAREANSRLSCQIPVSDALDGLSVTVAPED
ncbi:2Fe-2S iron-sulfur cluster-binding protein [Sphingomonas jaspsi]|uniref:2Fe-2S iron-sulfur cluster-binding protein n=1 Tax=Sphingomonas jaspsi TaxID=392409 RepID=UPI0004BC62CA|nr:2Fe-2S iron-sulfur cluster-binding protein [Sphingomonas jaspsi]